MKELEEFAEITYMAGVLHGRGQIGSPEHRQAAERSKELFQKIKEILERHPLPVPAPPSEGE